MKCEELYDYYELYAMGVADEPERGEIREHLNRGCEVCMTGMKRARSVTAMLGSTVVAAEPSPKLRRRILAGAGLEQRRFGWAPVFALATMFSLFAAVYFSGRQKVSADEAARLRAELRTQTIELTRLNEAFAILNTPGTVQATFGNEAAQPPKGKVFVSPSQGILLIASNLPPAPAGKIYEMWRVPKAGNPVPAGVFQSESDGTAVHVLRGAVDIPSLAAVAVTLENEGGATEPTMPLVFAASIQ